MRTADLSDRSVTWCPRCWTAPLTDPALGNREKQVAASQNLIPFRPWIFEGTAAAKALAVEELLEGYVVVGWSLLLLVRVREFSCRCAARQGGAQESDDASSDFRHDAQVHPARILPGPQERRLAQWRACPRWLSRRPGDLRVVLKEVGARELTVCLTPSAVVLRQCR